MIVAGPAATLQDAKRLIAEQTFDLALVDINLRGELAYELIDQLHHGEVCVVAMSGYAIARESIPTVSGFLQKPFRDHDLLALLTEVYRAR